MIQVLRTTQLDITASDLLREVMLEADLDFWKEPAPGKSADILVSEAQMSSVTAWLESHGIGYSTMVDNVQRLGFSVNSDIVRLTLFQPPG